MVVGKSYLYMIVGLSKEAIFHRVNLKMENFTLYMRRKGRTLTPSPNCKFAKGEEKTT